MIGPMRLAVDFFANVAERRRLGRVTTAMRLLAAESGR
jgi:hypothetical protein